MLSPASPPPLCPKRQAICSILLEIAVNADFFGAEPQGQGQSQDQWRGLPRGSSIGRELPMIEVAQILLMRTNFVGASEIMELSEIIYIIVK